MVPLAASEDSSMIDPSAHDTYHVTGDGWPASLYPQWCDPAEIGFLTRGCETVIGSPVWTAMMVADAIAIWFIVSILKRQRHLSREEREAKSLLSRTLRIQRHWGILRTMARLATTSGCETARAGAQAPTGRLAWELRWSKVAKIRADRKNYLMRKEFDLAAVFARALGPVLVAAMSSLIMFEVHAFFSLALPWWQPNDPGDRMLRMFAWFIVVRIVADYGRTALMDPGRPGSLAASAVSSANEVPVPLPVHLVSMAVDAEIGLAKKENRICNKCRGPKPPRCHHCKVCRRCVLKMDHHCPFVGNCVGLRNYCYFNLFLLDLVVGCVILSAALLPQFVRSLRLLLRVKMGAYLRLTWWSEIPSSVVLDAPPVWAHQVHVISAFLIAAIAAAILGPFLIFHLYLVSMNETTLEHMKRRSDQSKGRTGAESTYGGSALENFSEVFGPPPKLVHRHLEVCLYRLLPVAAGKRSV